MNAALDAAAQQAWAEYNRLLGFTGDRIVPSNYPPGRSPDQLAALHRAREATRRAREGHQP